MPATRLFPVVVLLTSCLQRVESKETGATGDTDTDTDADSDTDTDVVPASMTFLVERPGETSLVLALTLIDARETDSVQFHNTLLEIPVDDDSLKVELPDPDDGDYLEIDPTHYPGMEVAFYQPAIFADVDGDGRHDDEEVWLGLSAVWAASLRGALPADFEDLGIHLGWNAVIFEDLTGTSPMPSTADPDAVPVPANLWPITNIELQGSAGALAEESGLNLALVPTTASEGTGLDELLYDKPLVQNWVISIAGEPPESHFQPAEEAGSPDAAVEFGFVYRDTDATGYDLEIPLGTICSGSLMLGLAYVGGLTDLSTAFSYAYQGFHTGWNAVGVDQDNPDGSDPVLLSEDDLGVLTAKMLCRGG